MTKNTIIIGMGLPLTGLRAQSGQETKKGLDLALEQINCAGGIHNKRLVIDYQDTQGDPKQAVLVAQRFILNPQILLAGDFGTVTSMAAGPLYQRAGLVLFSFGSIHPDLTSIGDCIWSNTPPMEKVAAAQAAYAEDLGLKQVAVFFMSNDFGKTFSRLLRRALQEIQIKVAVYEAYLPDEKDFRPLISQAKAARVDGFILVSFFADGSLIVKQIRDQKLKQTILTHVSLATNKFPQLIGKAAEGVYIAGGITTDDPRPEVVNFVRLWKSWYLKEEIEDFSVHAYDSMILAAQVLKMSDGSRGSVKECFAQVKDIPSVIHGKVNLDSATRRPVSFLEARSFVKQGKVVRWNKNAAY